MIGIIGSELIAFPIIERIKEKYPECNIFVSTNSSILKEKGCQMILDTRKKRKLENVYLLDNKELIEAIKKGKEQEVKRIFKEIKIPKNQTIYLENPILLWVKKEIEMSFENTIIDSVEVFIKQLEEEIRKKNLNCKQEGKVIVIK